LIVGEHNYGVYMLYFLCYSKCSTCKKAKKWLESKNIAFVERDIVDNKPSFDEIREWYIKSGLPINRFFNTNGVLYREMSLKEKLHYISDLEKVHLLSTYGKLVKRPIVVSDDLVLVGFKEEEWSKLL
jgi:arsenate reductase